MSLEVRQTTTFARWLAALRDRQAKARILVTIERMASGHFGDAKALGAGVVETRLHVGPGYRLYYTRRGEHLVVLLAGGSKSTQVRDIAKARTLAAGLE